MMTGGRACNNGAVKVKRSALRSMAVERLNQMLKSRGTGVMRETLKK